jgi:hypothetical protein
MKPSLLELAEQLEREAREIEGDSDNPLRVAIANDLNAKAAALRASNKGQEQ